MTRTPHADGSFAKYAEHGPYRWREIGCGLLSHNAFTAERYGTVADRAGAAPGQRALGAARRHRAAAQAERPAPICNLLSIHAGVNAMTWLRVRPRLFMMQIVVAEKRPLIP